MRFLPIALAISYIAPGAFGAPKARTTSVDEFERTIDRFESEMMKRDREEFNFGSDGVPRERLDDPTIDVSGAQQTVKGTLPGQKELEAVSAALNRVDTEVDELSKDVEAFRNKAFRSSVIGNQVDLEVAVKNPELARLRSLTVRLDGFELYSIDDSNNLPLPATVIPVYTGPLQPGAHKVEIEARVALSDGGSALTLNSFAYKAIKKSIDISINEGFFRRRYTVELIAPSDRKDALTAELKSDGDTPKEPSKESTH